MALRASLEIRTLVGALQAEDNSDFVSSTGGRNGINEQALEVLWARRRSLPICTVTDG